MSALSPGARRTLTGLLWVSPWLVGGTLFLFVPMLLSAWYSLTDYPLIRPPVYVGLDNYGELFADARFWLTVKNTAIFALISIPLSTILALALAGLLAAKGLRLGRFYQAAVFIPTLVPLIASAMIWYWLFNGEYGLINQALHAIGIDAPPNWLGEADWAMPAMVITSLWGIGQGVVIYVAAINGVPTHLYEAARLDGMGPIRRWRSVTLPMISPVILFNVITLTIATLQVFAVPYVLFRNERGQRAEGYYYTMYLYDNAFVYQKMGLASAMAWMQLLVVLVLTGLMFLVSKRLVHYRAA